MRLHQQAGKELFPVITTNLGLMTGSESKRLATAVSNKVNLYSQIYNRLCNKEISFLWHRMKEAKVNFLYLNQVDGELVQATQKQFFRLVNWILRGTTPYKKTRENQLLYD